MAETNTSFEIVRKDQVQRGDCIIALFGATGSGKSNFIDKATGRTKRARASLVGVDSILAVRIERKGCGVVLLDTPGFDNAAKPNAAILKMVADWLGWETKDLLPLFSVIYCHPITESGRSDHHRKSLEMLEAMCFKFRPLVLMTTFCYNGDSFNKHEAELREDVWKNLLGSWGAKMMKFSNDRDSARAIIDCVLEAIASSPPSPPTHRPYSPYTAAQIHNDYRYLKITTAGQLALAHQSAQLQGLEERRRAYKSDLEKTRDATADGDKISRLQQKIEEIDREIDEVEAAARSLDISRRRRFRLAIKRLLNQDSRQGVPGSV